MKNKIKLGLLIMLLMSAISTVHATSIKEVEDKADELAEEKEAVETKQADLSANAEKLSLEMQEIQKQISAVYEEIDETEIELAMALVDKENQYDDMKMRIRYMYENSSTNTILELMLSVKNINDMLNKVDYAEQITAYDRRKLDEFQDIVVQIEEKQVELAEKNEKLVILQDEVTEKKVEVDILLAESKLTLKELEEEIGDNAKVLEALIKEAEEEAKRQAELAKQQAANNSGTNLGSAGSTVVSGNGTFAHPMPGYSYLSSPFGYRNHPISGTYKLHSGTDFAGSTGTPVYAAMGGTVTVAKYSSSAGNYITINHGNGLSTIYMHNSKLYVSAGDTVEKGQNIAASGNTGNSTGPHLHFQVMLNGTAVNPMNYL